MLTSLTRYKQWANERLFGALALVPEAEMSASRPIVFGSLLRTLNHVRAMDLVWKGHLEGRPHGFTTRNPESAPPFAELRQSQAAIDAWFVQYSERLSPAQADEVVAFEFIGGGKGALARGEMILHCVNHGTYHRGNVAAMLYQAGRHAARDRPSRVSPRSSREECEMKMVLGVLSFLLMSSVGAQTTDLQGHRGARGLLPENTLPGFQKALELGVTTLELDIAVTKDGVLAIYHDQTLNPDITRDASGRFIETPRPADPFAHLGAAAGVRRGPPQAGQPYGATYPDQQPVDGTRIPRLSDVFDLVKRSGNEKVRFAIETKLNPEKPDETPAPEPFARAVVDEIRKAGHGRARADPVLRLAHAPGGAEDRAGNPYGLPHPAAALRQHPGDSNPAGSPWTAGFQYRDHGSIPKMIKAAGGGFWSVYFGDLTPEAAQEAKALGLKVLTWTVNDPLVMGRMLDLGVDGLITDRPDLAIPVLKSRGLGW